MIGLLFAGCGKKEMTVGSAVKQADINEFYYNVDESTYPPQFFRYYFHKENEQWIFHFEKREADHWPLTEADVTESCDVNLALIPMAVGLVLGIAFILGAIIKYNR